MLRECTDLENRILKECKDDILTFSETYAFAYRSKILPFLLGFVVGLGLGAIIALLLPASHVRWVEPIILISVSGTIGVFEFLWIRLGKRKSRKAFLPGNKFRINGGVIINYFSYSTNDAHITIAEDDLRDEAGNPICIHYPAPMNLSVTIGQRILLAYSDNGAYIPMKLTTKTTNMIPVEPPAYFSDMNWKQATILPHPAVTDLDKTSYRMNEKDVEAFTKASNSLTSIRIKNWIGIVLFSILLLLLLGLLFIVLVAADVIKEPSVAIVVGVVFLLVCGILIFVLAKGILAGVTRGFKKLQYKKKVLFLSLSTDIGYNDASMSYLSFYEYVDGSLKKQNHLVHNNVFLPKDIPYGRVIYKYSKESESNEKGLNYFSL